MSLSNWERSRNIFSRGKDLQEQVFALRKSLDTLCGNSAAVVVREILSLCEDFWPALLSNESNSIHWLLGSSSSQDVIQDNEDPWSLAILSGIPLARDGKIETINHFDEAENFYDISDDFLPENILEKDSYDPVTACIIRVYRIIEGIIYALRRYNDNFLKNKKDLSALIAKIQGLCFCYLHNNINFQESYLISKISSLLYKEHFRRNESNNYKDVVDKWLITENMHHKLAVADRRHITVQFLAEQHLLLMNSISPKKDRVLVALRLMGKSFHNQYDIDKLTSILSKDKYFKTKSIMQEIMKEIDNCIVLHKTSEEESNRRYRDECDPRLLYGYEAIDHSNKLPIKKKESMSRKKKQITRSRTKKK